MITPLKKKRVSYPLFGGPGSFDQPREFSNPLCDYILTLPDYKIKRFYRNTVLISQSSMQKSPAFCWTFLMRKVGLPPAAWLPFRPAFGANVPPAPSLPSLLRSSSLGVQVPLSAQRNNPVFRPGCFLCGKWDLKSPGNKKHCKKEEIRASQPWGQVSGQVRIQRLPGRFCNQFTTVFRLPFHILRHHFSFQ